MHTASITRSVLLVYLGGEIITENGPIPSTIFLASGFTLLVHPNVIYCIVCLALDFAVLV
jgi:hypothetical protein